MASSKIINPLKRVDNWNDRSSEYTNIAMSSPQVDIKENGCMCNFWAHFNNGITMNKNTYYQVMVLPSGCRPYHKPFYGCGQCALNNDTKVYLCNMSITETGGVYLSTPEDVSIGTGAISIGACFFTGL